MAVGASSAYSSAHDLALFGMFHLKAHHPEQKAILSDTSINAMQQTTVSTGDGEYGLGWWIDKDRYGYRSVLGQGGWIGAMAYLRLIPSEGIAVAVLSNIGSGLPGRVVDAILSEMLPIYRQGHEAKLAAKQPSPPKDETPFKKPDLPPSLTGTWTGDVRTYRNRVPLILSFPPEGYAFAQLGTQPETILNGAKFNDERLSGSFAGSLGLEEGGMALDYLSFYLDRREDQLYGIVTMTGLGGRESYWVHLKKEKPAL